MFPERPKDFENYAIWEISPTDCSFTKKIKNAKRKRFKEELKDWRDKIRKEGKSIEDNLVPLIYFQNGVIIVSPGWEPIFLGREKVLELHREIDREEEEEKREELNQSAREAEIRREQEVNGLEFKSWFSFGFWWEN